MDSVAVSLLSVLFELVLKWKFCLHNVGRHLLCPQPCERAVSVVVLCYPTVEQLNGKY